MCVSRCVTLQCVCVCVCSVWSWDRILQSHVFSPSEGQPVRAVVMHYFRDAGEHTAALVQGEALPLAAPGLGHNDVHAALAGPAHESNAPQHREVSGCWNRVTDQ